MRGHKSCSPQEGLDAYDNRLLMLDLAEQYELLQEYGTHDDEVGTLEPFDWHLTTPFEDVLEEAVERLDGFRAQAMRDLAHLDTRIGVWILAPPSGDEEAALLFTRVAQDGIVVEGGTQNKANFCW